MKITISETKEIEVAFLQVNANIRYWEDGQVNGEEDTDGKIPFSKGSCWKPRIDLRTGIIQGWPIGTTADVHYKVCDEGIYTLQSESGDTVKEIDGYVPDVMCPGGNGYGDYIIMSIDENGLIQNFTANLSDFED